MSTLLEEINSGIHDERLIAMEEAIKDRLRVVRSSRASTDYLIGDRVVFNDFCGTRYLVGNKAVIVGKKKTKVVVQLENPVGRFATMRNGKVESTNITVPVSIIDKV